MAKTEKIQRLWDLHESIQDTLDEYGESIEQIRKSRGVAISDALEFSERVAPSAFAPLGWTEGLPLLNAFPPAPQADQMRLGKLSEYNRRIDQSLSSTSVETSERGRKKADSEALIAAIDKVKSLKERLRIKKEEEELRRRMQQEKGEEQVEGEKMEVEEEREAERADIQTPLEEQQQHPSFEYISTNTRRTSLTFAPAEESESEEEEDEE